MTWTTIDTLLAEQEREIARGAALQRFSGGELTPAEFRLGYAKSGYNNGAREALAMPTLAPDPTPGMNRSGLMPQSITVPLSSGQFAIIDAEDADCILRFKWSFQGQYAHRQLPKSEHPGKKKVYMHRVIANAPDGMMVDHINGNCLDNRKSNLRLATHALNASNSKSRTTNTSGFRGVTWATRSRKWKAQISISGRCLHLGLFESPTDAARAYDNKSREVRGAFAVLNFSHQDDSPC